MHFHAPRSPVLRGVFLRQLRVRCQRLFFMTANEAAQKKSMLRAAMNEMHVRQRRHKTLMHLIRKNMILMDRILTQRIRRHRTLMQRIRTNRIQRHRILMQPNRRALSYVPCHEFFHHFVDVEEHAERRDGSRRVAAAGKHRKDTVNRSALVYRSAPVYRSAQV